MAYDQVLAGRIRSVINSRPGIEERAVFGGLGFLINGNLALGIYRDELVIRMAPHIQASAVPQPGVLPFGGPGPALKGWIRVTSGACTDETTLKDWVETALEYVLSLPQK